MKCFWFGCKCSWDHDDVWGWRKYCVRCKRTHGSFMDRSVPAIFIVAMIGAIALVACTGCMVQPMPAHKMFGTSNPTAVMNIPNYGTLRIPTNAKIRYKMDKNPDGSSKFDLTMASDAAVVVDAEGNRILPMETQRLADFERVIQQEQIRSAERLELYKMGAELGKTVIPLLARPTTPELDKPPGAIDMAAIRAAMEAEIMEKLFASGVIPRPTGPPVGPVNP